MPETTSVPVEDKTQREARILWQKYFTLTTELLKFSDQQDNKLFVDLLDQRDNELFVDLVDQRERVLNKIKALPENNYRETPECKALIEKIIPMDKQIIYRAKAWLNKARRQTGMVHSYDLVGAAELRGTVFNKKY